MKKVLKKVITSSALICSLLMPTTVFASTVTVPTNDLLKPSPIVKGGTGYTNAYTSSPSTIDINKETENFSISINSGDCEFSPNYYNPYITGNGANLVLRFYNEDAQEIDVKLVDRTEGGYVDTQTTSKYRATLTFDNLDKNHVYYFEFHNHGSETANIEVKII